MHASPSALRATPTVVIGIDPGLRRTGFGVVARDARGLRYVASGTISTPAADLATRLGVIFAGLSEVLREYAPTEAAIEQVFVNVNPASTLLLGQARGAAITALVAAGLPVHEYTALQLKKSIAGHGHASKAQMQSMVQRLLSLPGLPAPDAADGLACALTHLQASTMAGVIARAAPRRGGRRLRIRDGRLV